MALKSYSVAQAQGDFSALLRDAQSGTVAICRGDETLAYLVSPEEWEVHLETAEVLANPEAMRALSDAKAGRTHYTSLDDLDAE
jgi:PHD/YefM family antitoxin component YafN of YafNO toxin-antitoxin module